jgi:hypothetical protein
MLVVASGMADNAETTHTCAGHKRIKGFTYVTFSSNSSNLMSCMLQLLLGLSGSALLVCTYTQAAGPWHSSICDFVETS